MPVARKEWLHNRFRWPGADLQPVPGKTAGTYAYGVLPPGLFRQVREGIASWVRSQLTASVLRRFAGGTHFRRGEGQIVMRFLQRHLIGLPEC
jgi:hypothetical protein